MKVIVILRSHARLTFNDVLRVDIDADNLYVYEGAFVRIYQTTIPLEDIKEYHVKKTRADAK